MVTFQSHVLLCFSKALVFFFSSSFLKISFEWTHVSVQQGTRKRLLGRCVQWWFHLRFQWRPCLWPVSPFAEQEHDNSPDSGFDRTCQLLQEPLLLCLCQRIDLSKNLLLLKRESLCLLLLRLAKLYFETQVFLNIASCIQTVIWHSVCTHNHNLQSYYIYLDWLRVCSVGVLKSVRGNEVNFVCTEASRSVPRATGDPPPSPQVTKLLPHLHIYVARSVQSLKSSFYYPASSSICGMFYFEKHSAKILFWEFLTVSFRNVLYPLFQQQCNKVRVCALSFDPLVFFAVWTFCSSDCP